MICHERVALEILRLMIFRKSHEETQLHVLAHLPGILAGVLLVVTDAGLVSSIRGRPITGLAQIRKRN